jgi:NAD(P)-dependent dehydrogenase (short-subunit alcohol dehydrogenase family)
MKTEKVVMITGAVGNLGLATAKAFHEGGHRTVLVDRSLDRLQKAYADLVVSPDHLLAGGVDLSSPAQTRFRNSLLTRRTALAALTFW